ncbi:hypothetical protein GH5_00554 [Leishmania sp. Ghana 2012 LV757]|uniref:hypothetical protein n=1 Tax=Leishmania sp. Ghana 2012 LV757 TaxID=2803181 RepID=UPI001B47FD47|nr:hypothetical protein GH5_00554 [Leishmania sp. Ghana 2012 LV757]
METPAPSSTAAAANAPSSRGSADGGRGTTRCDRGRGRGRGFSRVFREASPGLGRGRGGARGRGRGSGLRKRDGYASQKFMRHRSLSGKRGNHTPRDGEPAVKREKKELKPNSTFALLHSLLGDAATIAEYIREHHSTDKFREVKSVNTFLQAVSQRPKAVYEELMSQYKDEVFTALERLFALYALGKSPMIPPAHEFLIRCEQEGVRKVTWGEGVRTLPAKVAEAHTNTSAEGETAAEAPSPPPRAPVAPSLDADVTPLLSPRELLKKLAALDVVGHLQRRIEMASTIEEMQVCAKKLTAVLTDMEDDAERTSTFFTSAARLDYATKCQLISKLLSKVRRLVTPAFPLPRETAPSGVSDSHADGPSEESTVRREEEVPSMDGGEGPPQAASEAASSGTLATKEATEASAAVQRCAPLTEDEMRGFQEIIAVAFHALEAVLKQRLPSVTQQPLSKFSKMLEWCKEKGLLATADERFVPLLDQQAEKSIAEQAKQLETVIKLKSLTAGDTDALREVVDQLWEAGHMRCFSPSSMDVLSAIAVAASVDGIDPDVKRKVADRLAQTQCHLSNTVMLPRRALRFVNDERNKVKQAAITKQLQAERNRSHTGDGE